MSHKDELREKLAAIEHERWSSWQQWMHTKGVWFRPVIDSYLAFPEAYIHHLEDQIAKPYAELSDAEKASDMEQVDRYWALIEDYALKARKDELNILQARFVDADGFNEIVDERLSEL